MSISKELQREVSLHVDKIDMARSQLEDLKDELRSLWQREAFDFEDSIWMLEDALETIEQSLCLHDTPIENVA